MPRVYEIIVSHRAGEPCPVLPEGMEYLPESRYGVWHCPDPSGNADPTHLVFQRMCPIWKVRQIIEKVLFKVEGIERISLYYGGDRKKNDCYKRIEGIPALGMH